MGWFQLVRTDQNNQEIVVRDYSFDKNKNEIFIGRSSSCDIQVDNAAVSRKHAKIEITVINGNHRYTIYDLDSNNGTFVKEQKVMARGYLLQDRDCIKVFAQQTIIFRVGNMHHTGETHKLTYKL